MPVLRNWPAGALLGGALLVAVVAAGCGDDVVSSPDLCSTPECIGCRDSSQCQSGFVCETTSHTCVQCLADADCPAGSLCRAATHACVPACNATHGCGDAGVCQTDASVCVECVADGDCKDGKLPRCDGATATCVACLPSGTPVGGKDNCPAGQYCAVEGGVHACQAGCKDDTDCGGGSDGGVPARNVCDTTTHLCSECTADAMCGPGKVCRGGSCGDGCDAQHPCANGLTCCDGRCANLDLDPANCKACGVSCGAGLCCTGTCADPVGDPKNCGACGNTCAVKNGQAACASSSCAIGFCNPGFGDCNGSYADGCETVTDTNVNHCGGCNFACAVPNALAGCAKGACTVATCVLPFADCNGKPVDGCEINYNTDARNCGGCGNACSGRNVVSAACALGRCVSACTAGFADCNADKLGDGCEIAIATDVNNCGACGTVCSVNHGTPGCSAGACTIACAVGFGDCDGDIRNGCENPLNTNNNCGACGTLCNLAHAVSECTSKTCKIATCEAGWADCNGNPADGCEVRTATDAANCGVCGKACPAQNGQSACNGGLCSIVCGAGFADCNGNPNDGCETQVAASVANCGVCGSACSPNRIVNVACVAGACTGGCEIGWSDCNQNKRFDGCETNTFVDVNNCGICGAICAPAHAVARCTAGACGIAACEAGWANCDGAVNTGCEVSTDTDIRNCGACNRACGTANGAASCAAGSCLIACTAGFGDCNNNNADGCETNLNTNVNACGACGRACSLAHATPSCSAAACVISACEAGWFDCDGVAANGCETNIATDTQNCGVCGKRCSIVNDTPTCQAGVCKITCVGGYGDCNGNVDDGCEARLSTDVANCGACGVTCSPSHVSINSCAGGVCAGICAAGFADCNANKQIDGCEVNVAADTSNCGACGTRCSTNHVTGSACSAGLCTGACAAGFDDCDGNLQANGCEKGVAADINNCGGCGLVCSSNHVTPSCSGGACNGSCTAGFGDCNMNLQGDGCEVELATSVAHCGVCGSSCSGANVVGNACVAGSCAGVCAVGFADCDMNLRSDGCEVDTRSSAANCGGCGQACSGSHVVGSACAASLCTGTCAMGFGDCDLNLKSNGCEVDLGSSVGNCGACGASCAGNNVVGNACVAGACVGMCVAGFADCNMQLGLDGCEVDTRSDVANCGGCGQACSGAHVVGSACAASLCTGSCAVGFDDCDGNLKSNGCEVELAVDPLNCGACGTVCAMGESCVAGTCQ